MKKEQTVSVTEIQSWLPAIIDLMQRAGEAILEVYRQDFEITVKEDHSPVTQADIQSSQIITGGLHLLTPQIMVISEEAVKQPYSLRKEQQYVWMLDPLDGTKEFVKRNDEFAVCLALIKAGNPVFGIIYAPVSKEIYYAVQGAGCYKVYPQGDPVLLPHSNSMKRECIRVLTSKSHHSDGDQVYIDKLKESNACVETLGLGSALKFGRLAEGLAEVYPKFGLTMEWDTAAGQIILEESGGQIVKSVNFEKLRYNKEDLHNPFFIAFGSTFAD